MHYTLSIVRGKNCMLSILNLVLWLDFEKIIPICKIICKYIFGSKRINHDEKL